MPATLYLYGNNPELLADAAAVRHEVFVEGQGVPLEREQDGLDGGSTLHIVGYRDEVPVCAARVRQVSGPAGEIGDYDAKIERVAVLESVRGQNLGKGIMRCILATVAQDPLARNAVLESQVQAQGLYEKLGFVASGDVFDEVGIPHIKMSKPLR